MSSRRLLPVPASPTPLCLVLSRHPAQVISQGLWQLVATLTEFVPSLAMQQIIDFVSKYDGGAVTRRITFFVVLLFVGPILQGVADGRNFHNGRRIGCRVRGSLVGSIFRKMLVMDTSSSTYSSGQLTNLMSVDAQSVLEYSCYTHFIWATSLQASQGVQKPRPARICVPCLSIYISLCFSRSLSSLLPSAFLCSTLSRTRLSLSLSRCPARRPFLPPLRPPPVLCRRDEILIFSAHQQRNLTPTLTLTLTLEEVAPKSHVHARPP